VRLLDEHGVERYPFGTDAMLDLRCAQRGSVEEEPRITATGTRPVKLTIEWAAGRKTIEIPPTP
jgi:hypothetical protein